MNELKPVVIFKGVRHNSRTEIWGFLSSPDIVPQANTDLYQIPDTHKIVSVEFLERLAEETLYYASKKELQAIIDMEPS